MNDKVHDVLQKWRDISDDYLSERNTQFQTMTYAAVHACANELEKALEADCDHFPWVLMGLRPSTHEPFAVCQACGDTGAPTERSDLGFGKIVWDGKPHDTPTPRKEEN